MKSSKSHEIAGVCFYDLIPPGWYPGRCAGHALRQLLRHQGDAPHHRLQVQGDHLQLVLLPITLPFQVLSVLYQYESLTEDLDNKSVEVSIEKKRRNLGDKVKNLNGNTYVELKSSDVDDDEEEERIGNNNNLK